MMLLSLVGPYEVGLDARALRPDPALSPTRRRLLYLPVPWFTHWYNEANTRVHHKGLWVENT